MYVFAIHNGAKSILFQIGNFVAQWFHEIFLGLLILAGIENLRIYIYVSHYVENLVQMRFLNRFSPILYNIFDDCVRSACWTAILWLCQFWWNVQALCYNWSLIRLSRYIIQNCQIGNLICNLIWILISVKIAHSALERFWIKYLYIMVEI